ncbi:N-formylglutamate amidohydrolase [Kiloniella sp. b19]|uniref:N-formylglutamate amidohydrolase n=1 Tax=Kiloniella sp. GXU_MW_B19 TaxID=3141326 RepID=UPI0031D9B926
MNQSSSSPASIARPFTKREDALALYRPEELKHPLILSCPHSGRTYPDSFLTQSCLNSYSIRRSEDAYVDRMLKPMVEANALAMVQALFPRAYVDVNREELELDPAMFSDPLPERANTTSPRVNAGLGTVPRSVSTHIDIYDKPLPYAEAQARLEDCYRPYHQALDNLIREAQADFGYCIVLDCHSMPGLNLPGMNSAFRQLNPFAPRQAANRTSLSLDFVLGDRFGTSCHDAVSSSAQERLATCGFNVLHNTPYAGGYITRHYGAPSKGVHLLQIEISRQLYMDENTLEPTSGMQSVEQALNAVIDSLLSLDPDELEQLDYPLAGQ